MPDTKKLPEYRDLTDEVEAVLNIMRRAAYVTPGKIMLLGLYWPELGEALTKLLKSTIARAEKPPT